MGDNRDYVINGIVKIATSVIPDKIKLRLMEKIEDDWDKIRVAGSIKSDKIKLQVMDNIGIFEKISLAKTLSADEVKLQAIEKIENEWNKKDMSLFSLERSKAEIIATMKFDDIKLQQIENFKNDDDIEYVAKTLGNTD